VTEVRDKAPAQRGGLRGRVASTIDVPPGARGEGESPPGDDDDNSPGGGGHPPKRKRRHWIRGTLLLLVLLVLLSPLIFLAVLGGSVSGGSGQTATSCTAGADGQTLPSNLTAPGQLGGIAGTGITDAEYAAVKRSAYASSTITPGEYVSTAYGPPWGGIQGEGIQTSGGLTLNGGSPQKYFIAVDPKAIGHGTMVYVWPNPFGWAGPFLAADTGGAILERRIDFYDWRGRTTQYGWGRRVVTASATPLTAGGGGPPTAAPTGVTPEPVPATGAACGLATTTGGAWGAAAGEVEVAPGADRPEQPTQPVVLEFLRGAAGRLGRKIVISTGSNHEQYVSGSGNVSDHYAGMAADLGSYANNFPIGGDGGTQVATAALITAGVPPEEAQRLAAGGGGHNVCSSAPDGTAWRVQVLWRTYSGGDHYNHVHVGLQKGCSFTGVQSFG